MIGYHDGYTQALLFSFAFEHVQAILDSSLIRPSMCVENDRCTVRINDIDAGAQDELDYVFSLSHGGVG